MLAQGERHSCCNERRRAGDERSMLDRDPAHASSRRNHMFQGKWWKSSGVLIGLAASACATETRIDNDPIAEVQLENRGVVSFYEPTPGELMITHYAPHGVE